MNKYVEIIRSISEMKTVIRQLKDQHKSIGFVPTMGWLHEGHLSLIRAARKENQIVVISVFVNPMQFGPQEDYNEYPRDLKYDTQAAQNEGVDYIFYPAVKEMYPEGFQTKVIVTKLKNYLCGISRPTHFDGVTTVLTKLFNIVEPDNVYFGLKDAQQSLIVNRMIQDLNFPIKMHTLPIVREPDGLAMSSRNKNFTPEERKSALSLYRALMHADKMIKNGETDPNKIKTAIHDIIASQPFTKIDYIEIVNYNDLEPIKKIGPNTMIALAVWVGKVRLIDNILI
jgi:pantoate--beta-alanine ligase